MAYKAALIVIILAAVLTKIMPKRWQYYLQYECVSAMIGTLSLLADIIYRKQNRLDNPHRRPGHIAIVTGGGRGMGPFIVKGLMNSGMTVVIGVRRPEDCQKLLEDMQLEYPQGKVSVCQLDTSSLSSVRKFSETFLSQHKKLHILVNNAGVLHGAYKLTEDGFENQLATNYMGHALLTHLMMDSLRAAAKDCDLFSRIVHVSSCAHVSTPIFFDDINMKKCYNEGAGYSQSKLAQLMMSRALDRIFEKQNTPIRSYAVHPGIVSTEMLSDRFKGSPMLNICKTPAEGALTVLYACLSPELEKKGGGRYISNCVEGYSTSYSKSEEKQERLFKYTMELLNIKEF